MPTAKHSTNRRQLNALAILIGVVWVIWEPAQRFGSPVEVPGLTS